jgi:hypothetical protein
VFKFLLVILGIFSHCYAVYGISLEEVEQIKQSLREFQSLGEQIIKAIQNKTLKTLDRSKVDENDIQKMGQIILNPTNKKHPVVVTFNINKCDFELWLQMIWGLNRFLHISVSDTITLFQEAMEKENTITYFEEEALYSDEQSQLLRIIIDEEIDFRDEEYKPKTTINFLALTLDKNYNDRIFEWQFYKKQFWDIPIISDEGIMLFFQDIARDVGEQFNFATKDQFIQVIKGLRKELSENNTVSLGCKQDRANLDASTAKILEFFDAGYHWKVNISEFIDGGYQIETRKTFNFPYGKSLTNQINEI